MKLVPQHEDPFYLQSLPTPTIFKDALLFEHALMQEYGIIITFAFSKYSSPIFAQRKPNVKLRILADLHRINHLLKHHYGEHNHPVTAISNATQQIAAKKFLYRLNWSQEYHCMQVADEQSVQLIPFSFGSRTLAYQHLA